MGDNIHQLTSLPYSNFQDEGESDEGHSHPGHGHSHDGHGHSHGADSPSSIHVEVVTGSGRNGQTLLQKFNAMGKEKKITYVLAVVLVVLSLFSIIYASVDKSRQPMQDHLARCKTVDKFRRIDAGFGLINSRKSCESWGACWDSTAIASTPKCFYSFDDKRGYRVANSSVTPSGMDIDLERKTAHDRIFESEEPALKCIISYETDSRLRIKIYNPDKEDRYEVPKVPISGGQKSTNGHKMQYTLDVSQEMFGFSVSRTHELQSTILNTTLEGLIFSDQLLQINMALSSSNVYGLSGDHKDGLLRKMEYNYQSLWSTAVEKRHGAHPFLLHVEKDGHASGIFLRNSNAMDVILNPYPAITFRTTGGILDFYIFLGPSPADVMSQFSDMIGKTFMPPLWALGYHFGSDSYTSSPDIGVQKIVESSFPVDGVWVGSSTLKEGRELTIDSGKFENISDVTTALHEVGKYFLVDTRPAVTKNDNYELYTAGEETKIFVRDADNETLVVKVATGQAVLPDYFNPATLSWLMEGLKDYHNEVAFDGLYLLENEPSTLSDGSVEGCTDGKLDNPTYTLYNVPILEKQTLCPSALHYGGLRHYDVHNIYGWRSSVVTAEALAGVSEKRTLLLSRSTYLGSGAVTGHFIKENTATWADMKHSIVAMLNYNMYGVPLVGANICGYTTPTEEEDEELCVRWHQLATFYPFAKRFSQSQKSMFAYSAESLKNIQTAVEHRYTLLPVLYTLFYRAHTQGVPVVRPLFFDHLTDPDILDIGTQFMFGDSIMVAPVLDKGVTNHSVYFPEGVWYDYKLPNNIISDKGYQDQKVVLEEQTYYVKGGSVVIRYKNIANNTHAMNVGGDYILDVYLSSTGQSYGELFSDDGVTLNTIQNNQYLFVKINATQEHLVSEVTLVYPGHDNNNKIQEINVRGLSQAPASVTVKGDTDAEFTFENGVLYIKSLELPVKEAFSIQYS